MKPSLLAALTLSMVPLALGAPKSIKLPPDNPMANLKPGPGVEVVRANCALCHSTDYIVRQQGGDAQHWDPEVRKMITVFGAPVSDDDVKTIVNYLATEYGPQKTEGSTKAEGSKKR